MKVTLINTSDAGGGAPAACMRLLKALELKQVDVYLQVQHKKTADKRVLTIEKGTISRIKAQFNFLYERIPFILFHAKDRSVRFAFSTANTGTDISREPIIKDADILHLHWTNAGYLSIENLEQLIALNKPIVWTLHDMWTFTGGCHYSGPCDHFIRQCGDCYFLRDPGEHDLSRSGWLRKLALYSGAKNITFVTCSHWLADVARQSSLLNSFRIETIPNPIDTRIFSPQNKTTIREKWGMDQSTKIILFGAANIMDRRKGITYLVEALQHLKNDYLQSTPVEIVIFGKNKHFDTSQLPFKVHELNIITSEKDMAEIYSMADVYVSPSVEDNLPNTIMEALSCGTPVVAFNTGGIPDMVVHQQNGYLAGFKSSKDLAAGINEVLYGGKAEEMAVQARKKVLDTFNNEKVAIQYIDLYKSLLNQ